jgi:hypothetical protein
MDDESRNRETSDAFRVYFVKVGRMFINIQREGFLVFGRGFDAAKHNFSYPIGSYYSPS